MKVILYTAKYCPYSLRARIALAEKKMAMEIVEAGDLAPEVQKKISPNGLFPLRLHVHVVSSSILSNRLIISRLPSL